MFDFDSALKNLPDQPGVYIMMDDAGGIIYIGKARSLKNRVRQYFHSPSGHTAKVRAMVENIASFRYIITDSELEALLLESNLIKKHKPYYNIVLKDDKHYPYVKIDVNKDYPKIEIVRRTERDGARYFGPYAAAHSMRDALSAVKKLFPLRTCGRELAYGKKSGRPCLNYQIGQCLAPCTGTVTRERYHEVVAEVCDFLEGRHDGIIERLKAQMTEAAESMDYERAATLRDRIDDIRRIGEKQKTLSVGREDRDVFALSGSGGDAAAEIFTVRDGRLSGGDIMPVTDNFGSDEGEIISAVLTQYYSSADFIPKEVILPAMPDDAESIAEWLRGLKGRKVELICPKRGEKKKLLDMAQKNAQEAQNLATRRRVQKQDRKNAASAGLAAAIGLDKVPYRIEAYDISNIQGTDSVASMVVFEGGEARKSEYRRFRIKTVEGPNDFASMAEVITRRFARARQDMPADGSIPPSGFGRLPDVVLIDGGRGQLGYALEAMHSQGFDIKMFGLAKQFEDIILPDREEPVRLARHSDALHLIQAIRDEAHRFAITYHRSLRTRRGLRSELEKISGVGEKRRDALFTAFRTMEGIKAASEEDIAAVPGMNKKAAAEVWRYFHEEA